MTAEELHLLRELIQAEVYAGIVGSVPDESGYFGGNHAERADCDRIFRELVALVGDKQ